MTPAVSVLMPVYNTGRYLREAIDSLTAQSFADFELLLIDDGSTDHSARIAQACAERDPRIRVRRRGNKGIGATRVELGEWARAPYIALADSDDASEPERLARQVAYLDAHPDCVLLGTAMQLTDPYGIPTAVQRGEPDHAAIDAALLRGESMAVAQPTAMMRRAAYLEAGGYNPALQRAEDLDLFLRMAELGQVANLPEPLVRYRHHLGSVTFHRNHAENAAQRDAILTAAHARRGIPLPADRPWDAWTGRGTPGERSTFWAWNALRHGEVAAARRHSWTAVRLAPGSAEAWKAWLCALRGH
jgi:glycosyltransferase involved in cell wall biosynthesis